MISKTQETINKIQYLTFSSRTIKIDDDYECSMQEFMDANDFPTREDEAKIAITLYNLKVGESVKLNWMTAPTITRIK